MRNDAEFLKSLILSRRSDSSEISIAMNGHRPMEAALETPLAMTRIRRLLANLRQLELILEAGVIPHQYKSVITQEMHYPSPEERIKKAEPLPIAKYTMFSIKRSRKESTLSNSVFNIIRTDTTRLTGFFVEHRGNKDYPDGGFAAKVKKGYLCDGSEGPKYAVKIYRDNNKHTLRMAMRAAYCYKQLGRDGFVFRRNNKQYMVTQWLQGKALDYATPQDIQSMPIPRRIVMAISLLRELSILHRQGLIHNDIKPGNVMVSDGKLNFVDLDSVRPKNEIPLYGVVPVCTSDFLPNPRMIYDLKHDATDLYLKFNEATDRYAMGITLVYLFPEIYTPHWETCGTTIKKGTKDVRYTFNKVSLIHGKKYNSHPQLQKCLKKLVSGSDSVVTIDQFIAAFQTVLSTDYCGYEQYLKEDRLVGLGSELVITDGAQAFKEIEIELLRYNQMAEALIDAAVANNPS
ncbi:MAG: hypothetical protein Q8R83_07330 [Legionellaceae bacterium]|nr:hypothetical protein [Legionellaceae bacterium]